MSVAGIADSITQEGYDAVCDELDFLCGKARDGLAQRLRETRDDGEDGENPAGFQARHEQMILERRIAELEAILARACVFEFSGDGTAQVGSRVLLAAPGGSPAPYQLVGALESDVGRGRLSVASPVGGALLGRRPGALVEVDTASGARRYELLEVDGRRAALAA
jgi:transcription elongation factor GreA